MSSIPTAKDVDKSHLDLDFWGCGTVDMSTTAGSQNGHPPSGNEGERLSGTNGDTISKCFTREFQASLFQLVGGFGADLTRKFSAGVQQPQEFNGVEELSADEAGQMRNDEDTDCCCCPPGVISSKCDDFKTELQEDREKEIQLLKRISGDTVALREKLKEIVSRATEERNTRKKSVAEERQRLETLEQRHQHTLKMIDALPSGSRNRSSLLIKSEAEMADRERHRKILDNLEFQLLEAESNYEQEKEVIQQQFMNDQKQITDLYEQRQLLKQSRLKDRTNEDYITALRQELSSSLATPGGGLASDPVSEATRRRRLTFLDVHADQVIEEQRRRLEELRTKAALDAHLSWDRRRMMTSSSSFDSPENGHLDPGRENQPSEERHPGVMQIPTESQTSLPPRPPPRPPPPRSPPRSLQSSDPIDVENRSESPPEEEEDSSPSNSEQMSNISSVSNDNDQRVVEMMRQLEAAQAEKRLLLQAHMRQTIVLEELRSEKQKRLELEERLEEEMAKRNVDQGQAVSLRQDAIRQARPLTRYLPVRSGEIDLPEFLEQCGHAFELCPHLSVSSKSARGQLTKMGLRIRSWHRRWFVFDRTQRHLAYYVDRTERRRKGAIPFDAIEDVYGGGGGGGRPGGGGGGVKSPSPSLTFCVKTKTRTYHIVAPSNESMRIWIDVIFTGAEGYQEFV